MKKLIDYLNESIINESNETYVRFTPGDLENAKETISSIKSLAGKAEIYIEDIDNGVKLKVTDKTKEKFGPIQDVIQQYIDGLQNNEKVDQSKVEALAKQLNKLNDILDEEDEEDETTKNTTPSKSSKEEQDEPDEPEDE